MTKYRLEKSKIERPRSKGEYSSYIQVLDYVKNFVKRRHNCNCGNTHFPKMRGFTCLTNVSDLLHRPIIGSHYRHQRVFTFLNSDIRSDGDASSEKVEKRDSVLETTQVRECKSN